MRKIGYPACWSVLGDVGVGTSTFHPVVRFYLFPAFYHSAGREVQNEMSCRKIRARIQQWFDAPGVSTISPEIAAHVRECGECKSLITRWNAIELQIQSMKTECPEISPDFAVSLRERLRNPDARRA